MIDKRKNYYLIIDTETMNGGVDDRGNTLVYDIGMGVIDKQGTFYEKYSFVIKETFFGMGDIMESAYYANKIPQYFEDLYEGKRQAVDLMEAVQKARYLLEKYDCVAVVAHNAMFDYLSTNNSIRYITKSAKRYFFTYGTIFYDTLKIANDTICKQKSYKAFCKANNYMTAHKTPRPKATAEVIYRYITGNNDFVESHTGAEDIEIEAKIFAHCFRQHKKMRKELFNYGVAE